jgi:transposase InsO family protein
MSWKETDPMKQRELLIADSQSGLYTVTELAERYTVSRKTIYKWTKRYERDGPAGLQEHSRAARTRPHQTPEAITEQVLAFRRRHPGWGPRTIQAYLKKHQPEISWPAASTIGDLFDRHGLTSKRPRRRHAPAPERATSEPTGPNQLWCCDFKGEFLLGNRQYCYPLTVTDQFSRMLLGATAQSCTQSVPTHASFARIFAEYGLPEAMLSDNGAPFAGKGPRRISRLSLWWLKLGIRHVLSRPGCPQDNPRHERMHRRMKAETTRPPAADLAQQQLLLDAFATELNSVRPHQGIGMQTPSQLYQRSARALPSVLPEPEYPGHYERRIVANDGTMYFRGQRIFLSEVLGRETVGLEEVDDDVWSIHIYTMQLGRLRVGQWRLF